MIQPHNLVNPKDPLYFSTLINLVFCLIIKENYLEAIFYLKMKVNYSLIQIIIKKTSPFFTLIIIRFIII